MSGTITLGAVAARTDFIEIRCRACTRHGYLRTDRLARDHGPEMPMPELLRTIAGTCPKLVAAEFHDRCDIHSPTLAGLFG